KAQSYFGHGREIWAFRVIGPLPLPPAKLLKMLAALRKVKCARPKSEKDRVSGRSLVRCGFDRAVLSSSNAVGNSGGNWHAEILVLICLHHQQNPQNQPYQAGNR